MLSISVGFPGHVASAQTKILSVAAYGAKCDGRTDDTVAFQAASKAASSSYSSTPGRLPVTVTYAGTCVINGSILVQSGVHWHGNGQIKVARQPVSPPTGAPH